MQLSIAIDLELEILKAALRKTASKTVIDFFWI